MHRRILFVLGFFPVTVALFFRWVATGKSAMDSLAKFEKWSQLQ